MKIQSAATIKVFIIGIAVLSFLTLLTANSKENSVVVNASDGANIYATSCAKCHGSDGRAQTSKGKQTGATDFTSAKWKPSEAKAIRAITSGKGKMPAFKGTLSPDEMKSVWQYVRGFKR